MLGRASNQPHFLWTKDELAANTKSLRLLGKDFQTEGRVRPKMSGRQWRSIAGGVKPNCAWVLQRILASVVGKEYYGCGDQ